VWEDHGTCSKVGSCDFVRQVFYHGNFVCVIRTRYSGPDNPVGIGYLYGSTKPAVWE
jgi:hypothetical protein